MATARHDPKLADKFIEDGQGPALPDESDYAPPWLEIDRLKAEFGLTDDDVMFQVFREGPGGYRDISFIKSVPPDEFGYEMLQGPPYNGGKFRVYIRNHSGFKRNFGITVEPGANALAHGQSAPVQDNTAALIAAMSQGFQNLSQQLSRAPQPQQFGARDMIELMVTMKPLMTAPVSTTPAPDPFTMLTKLVELQKAVMPIPTDGDGGISGTAVLLKAMDTFGPVLANGLNRPATPPAGEVVQSPAPPALAAPEGYTRPVNDNPAQENETVDELKLKVSMIAPLILLAAHDKADTYPYACNVLDLFDDEQIAKYIAADDWWTQLCAILPDAAVHQEWFVKLREEVLTLLQSDAEPDSVPGTPS